MTSPILSRRAVIGGASLLLASGRHALASGPAEQKPGGPGIAPLADVSGKFGSDGNVRPWPGDTIITPLPITSPAFAAMLEINAAVTHDFRDYVAATPPSSYHMTIFGGADAERKNHRWWPSDVPLDASIDTVNQAIAEKLARRSFRYTLPIRMVVDTSDAVHDSPAVFLRPQTKADAAELYRLRRAISDTIGIATPDIDTFRFHLTFGYIFRAMPAPVSADFGRKLIEWRRAAASAAPVILFGQPAYCVFEDMFAFRPIAPLRRQT